MKLRVALAQINPTVGNLAGNAGLIAESVKSAQAQGANLIVFPEMIVTGYPVEDLALRPSFQAASIRTVGGLVRKKKDDILALDGIGPKGLEEIVEMLAKSDLHLEQ